MKRIRILCYFFLLFSFLSISLFYCTQFSKSNEVIISGSIQTADGKTANIANVELTHISQELRPSLKTVCTDNNGKYEIRISEAGMYSLLFSSPQHELTAVPIVIEERNIGDEISLDITLPVLNYKSSFDSILIFVPDTVDTEIKFKKMQKQPDGTFIYEVNTSSDSIFYFLRGVIENDRFSYGIIADKFICKNSGYYISYLYNRNGKIKIVFDPARIIKAQDEDLPEIKFDKDHSYLYSYFEMTEEFNRLSNKKRKEGKDKNYCVEWGKIIQSSGKPCLQKPPNVQMLVLHNGSTKEVLTEEALKWGDYDLNIPGNGFYGIELGNFQNPKIKTGDSFKVIFTFPEIGERGAADGIITELPDPRGINKDITMTKRQFPTAPENVSIILSKNLASVEIKWDFLSQYTYSVYRRTYDTPGRYDLIAENLRLGKYVDSKLNPDENYGYIVFAKTSQGDFSSYSVEVGNLEELDYLKQKMVNGETKDIRQFAAMQIGIQIISGFRTSAVFTETIYKVVPPSSPYWAVKPHLFDYFMNEMDKDKKERLRNELLAKNPDRVVKAFVLTGMMKDADKDNDPNKLRTLYEKLKTNYADFNIFYVKHYLEKFNPDKRIKAGNLVPDFELKLMDSEQVVSNKSLLGKYYLVDFWAVWCGPCVGEMPKLHQAYEKFKDKNFTMISISLDRKPEDVQKFQKDKWKMPWMNVFVEGETKEKVIEDFEVRGIPKPILIGPDGVILVEGGALRSETLENTLTKYVH